MSGVVMSVDVKDEQVKALLSGMISRAGNPAPGLSVVGEMGVTDVKRHFVRGGPPGEPWVPSARVTRKGGKTLVLNRHLMGGIHYRVEGDTVTLATTKLPYAAIHNFGGTISVPARRHVLHLKKFESGKRKGQVRFALPDKATLGMKVDVGAHEIKMPRREYMVLSKPVPARMLRALRNYVTKGETK